VSSECHPEPSPQPRSRASPPVTCARPLSGTAPTWDGTYGCTPQEIFLLLFYKVGWTAEQREAADRKASRLNVEAVAGLLFACVACRGPSASRLFRLAGKTVLRGTDVDHIVDLQLGGSDDLHNLEPLDRSVNRSLGAQIAQRLRVIPIGTKITSVRILPR
jgi:hypothetical protein